MGRGRVRGYPLKRIRVRGFSEGSDSRGLRGYSLLLRGKIWERD
jgi:hypothetical protein